MSTRNPMNERYTSEDGVKGVTKKSPASAKPIAKAGSTVRVREKPVTKREKAKEARAKDKQQRQMMNRRLQSMGQPTDPKYRFWRKVWVASLVAAIVAIILSWVLRANFANGLVASYVFLGLSYAFIFVALFVDFRKVRPFRRAQEREAAKPLSKNQQRKLEKEEQLAAAARKAEEERVKAERQEKRTAFKSKIGIGRSGKSDSGDEASPDGEGASDRE